jgi:small subunit ribosomal protein S20
MRTIIKSFHASVDKDPEEAKKILEKAIPVISKAASKGIIHKNTASRKISRLTKQLNVAATAVSGS